MNSQLGVMSILVNRGADINRADAHGERPLILAACNGRVGVVQFLLSQEGMDLDAQDADGCTALLKASFDGRVEVLRLLLAAGADPRIANNDGETPCSNTHIFIELLEVRV